MTRCRLFCPQLTTGSITLPAEEAHHAVNVLRVREGQSVAIFDGQGCEAVAIVERVHRRELYVRVEAVSHRPFELPCRLTLAVAMPKQHRQGYLIEKCTELGVADVWPIIAERATVRPRAEAIARWRRRALEAAKQSQRAWLPTIAEPQTFASALARIPEFDAVVMAHLDPEAVELSTWFADHADAPTILAWVGPEGGWSEAELARAEDAGIANARLTPTVLRSETAAVAVCTVAALCSLR